MSLSAAAIRLMATKGLSANDIADIAEANAAETVSAASVRQARYRSRGGGKIPEDLRMEVFERDGWICLDCGAGDNLCCDHVIPVSKGGETAFDNLQTLCIPCNSRKKDRVRKRDQKRVRGKSTEIPRKTSPNEYISNPHRFDVSSETSAVSDFGDRVVDAWNAGIEGTALPAARKLNPDRRKHLAARAREHGEEAVFAAISNMQRSDFHSGRDGKWTEGNLGWLLKSPENFQKMLERTNIQPPGSPQSNLAILSEQAQRYRRPEAA